MTSNKSANKGLLVVILLVICFLILSYISARIFINPERPTMNYFLYALVTPVLFAIISGIIVFKIFKRW